MPAPRAAPPAPPFATVLERHGRAVLRFCLHEAGPDAGHDVFQETMIAALRGYDAVRDPTAVKGWLFSIAARKVIDAHRARARAPRPVIDVEAEGRAGDRAASDHADDGGQDLWSRVARLPLKQRQAVTLRYLADLTNAEVAEVMQISEAAVRRNVFEGLRRLRRDLTQPTS